MGSPRQRQKNEYFADNVEIRIKKCLCRLRVRPFQRTFRILWNGCPKSTYGK